MKILTVLLVIVAVGFLIVRYMRKDHRRRMCDMLNEQYGGDWYYDKKRGKYFDYLTSRYTDLS